MNPKEYEDNLVEQEINKGLLSCRCGVLDHRRQSLGG